MPGYSIYYKRNYVGSLNAKDKKQAISKAKKDYEIGSRLGGDPKAITAEKHSKASSYNYPNPSKPKKGTWIKAKAIKFNKNGSVSIKK